MKPPPKDWPRISSALFYDDASAAIDWLCKAFGFVVRLRVDGEDGSVVHSELEFGEGLVMVGSKNADKHHQSPASLGGANTQNLCVQVEDCDAHYARARAAGARIYHEPQVTDYGAEYWSDKGYGALDLEGHRWYFAQRLRG